MSEIFEPSLTQDMIDYMKIKATYDPARLDGIDVSLAQRTTQLNSVYNNQTVANMKTNSNVVAGNVIKTFGFYSFGDGGGAEYLVVSNTGKTGNDVTLFDLPNTLQAKLIHNGSIKAEQIGCKRDVNYDNTPNIVKGIGASIKDFYFQAGNYQFNELLITYSTATDGVTYNLGCNVRLHGATPLTFGLNAFYATIFSPYQANQRFILKFGGEADFSVPAGAVATDVDNVGCMNIGFDDKNLATTKGCLALEYVYSGHFSVGFYNNYGRGMYLKNCWELDFDKFIVRDNFYKGEAFFIDDALNDGASNTSRIQFNEVDLEGLSGTFLKATAGSLATNIMIGTLSYEHNFSHAYPTQVQSPIIDPTVFAGLTKIPLFDIGFIDGLTIGELNLNGMSKRSFTDGTTNFTDSLFRFSGFFNVSVSNINVNDGAAFLQLTDGAGANLSILKVGTLTSSPKNRMYVSQTSTNLLVLSTVALGGVVISHNSFKEKDDFQYAKIGYLYKQEELLKLCGGVKTDYTLKYDASSIYGSVFARTALTFQTLFKWKITVPSIKLHVRIKTDNTAIQIGYYDVNGTNLSTDTHAITGDANNYQEFDYVVTKGTNVDSFRFIVPTGGTVCNIDYIYMSI